MMKLTYFNGRGLAETSRLIFSAAGVDFEDNRYPLTVLDWSTFKMERKEFDEDKANGKLWQSLDKLPFLEVEGEVICQSKAIERFLATKFDMMGSTPLEAAKIDSLCEWVRDFKDMYQKVRNASADEKEEAKSKFFGETLPERLVAFNKIVAVTSCSSSEESVFNFTGSEQLYAVGSRLSLADIVIYAFLVEFFDDKEMVQKAYETCDKLKAIVNTVSNVEGIQKWLETRPQTPF
jgi:glutathione S-transferase